MITINQDATNNFEEDDESFDMFADPKEKSETRNQIIKHAPVHLQHPMSDMSMNQSV